MTEAATYYRELKECEAELEDRDREITQLRAEQEARIADLEEQRDTWQRIFNASEAELTQLRAERDRVAERLKWFEDSGGVVVHTKVHMLRHHADALAEALLAHMQVTAGDTSDNEAADALTAYDQWKENQS